MVEVEKLTLPPVTDHRENYNAVIQELKEKTKELEVKLDILSNEGSTIDSSYCEKVIAENRKVLIFKETCTPMQQIPGEGIRKAAQNGSENEK